MLSDTSFGEKVLDDMVQNHIGYLLLCVHACRKLLRGLTESSRHASMPGGSALLTEADPYADNTWQRRLLVNLESLQFPVPFLLS